MNIVLYVFLVQMSENLILSFFIIHHAVWALPRLVIALLDNWTFQDVKVMASGS
jgi:hypothetical protein